MTNLKPGDRVRWIPEQGDSEDLRRDRGTVRAPTPEELAYVATWSSSARAAIDGHVIVWWDGEEEWEGAWIAPDELEPAPR